MSDADGLVLYNFLPTGSYQPSISNSSLFPIKLSINATFTPLPVIPLECKYGIFNNGNTLLFLVIKSTTSQETDLSLHLAVIVALPFAFLVIKPSFETVATAELDVS